MDMPPMPPADPMAAPSPDMGMSAPSEVCVPIASLTMEAEDLKSVAPEVGDPVEFTATGTVSRVEGGNAYLTLETVNGDPVAAPEAEAMPDMGGGDLRDMASQFDNEQPAY